MFKIDLKPLKNYPGKTENYIFNNELSPFITETETLVFNGPVLVEVSVTNSEGSFLVKGHTKGQVELKCGRCLDDFLLTFDAEVDQIYRPGYLMDAGEGKADDSNDEVITFQGDSLDITPEILKSIFMSLPMKAICVSDCKGLCQHCGINLNKERCNCITENIDPRLAVLKGFLKD